MQDLDCRRVGDTELRTVQPGTADYRRWIDLSADAYPSIGLISAEQRDERLAATDLFTFGYADGNALSGYLTYAVRLGKPGTVNRDDLFVHELIYESPAALAGLLAFARSQSDQFAALILNTQDPDMHFLLDDPRNGSDRRLYPPAYHETNVQGLGVMYRIVNLNSLISGLADRSFGDLDAIVRLRVGDDFFAVNAGMSIVGFRAGRPVTLDAATRHDVELSLDVADLAALVMGSVRLSSLVAYGRAGVSHPDWLARLDAAFMTKPPQCLTRF